MTCRLDQRWQYAGLNLIRLENSRVAIDVLPERGANIFRFIDKEADTDVLWKNPRVAPHRAHVHADFDDHWAGGWDEAFPGGSPSKDRYGALLPYMGEVWSAPARCEVVESSADVVALRSIVETPITPARFERVITLRRDAPTVDLSYRITNLSAMPFDFNWGVHPCLALTEHHRFDIPALRGEVDEAGGSVVGETGERYDWPFLRGTDLSRAMPAATAAFALHYLTELTAGWWASTNTATKRGFGMAFDREVFPVVWFVPGYGGFRGFYQVLIEPWTGFPTALADARAAGRSLELAAGKVFETHIIAAVYSGLTSVSGITLDGAVQSRGHDGSD